MSVLRLRYWWWCRIGELATASTLVVDYDCMVWKDTIEKG